MQFGAFGGSLGTIDVQFMAWNDPVPTSNKTLFLYWENYGVSLDSIISGSQDAVISKFASQVPAGTIVSVLHEMNGNWDSWDGTVGSNSPQKVIQAYKRIHDVLGNKVKFAWVVNNISVPNIAGNQITDYYPGDAYVDIVGVDGFTYSGETFSQMFPVSLMNTLKSYNKPVWITSIGTSFNKPSWITDMVAKLPATGVSGLLYFDYDVWKLDAGTLALIH